MYKRGLGSGGLGLPSSCPGAAGHALGKCLCSLENPAVGSLQQTRISGGRRLSRTRWCPVPETGPAGGHTGTPPGASRAGPPNHSDIVPMGPLRVRLVTLWEWPGQVGDWVGDRSVTSPGPQCTPSHLPAGAMPSRGHSGPEDRKPWWGGGCRPTVLPSALELSGFFCFFCLRSFILKTYVSFGHFTPSEGVCRLPVETRDKQEFWGQLGQWFQKQKTPSSETLACEPAAAGARARAPRGGGPRPGGSLQRGAGGGSPKGWVRLLPGERRVSAWEQGCHPRAPGTHALPVPPACHIPPRHTHQPLCPQGRRAGAPGLAPAACLRDRPRPVWKWEGVKLPSEHSHECFCTYDAQARSASGAHSAPPRPGSEHRAPAPHPARSRAAALPQTQPGTPTPAGFLNLLLWTEKCVEICLLVFSLLSPLSLGVLSPCPPPFTAVDWVSGGAVGSRARRCLARGPVCSHRFAMFHKVRIPRQNLLNRTGDVTPEGTYVTRFKVRCLQVGKPP